MKRFAIVYLGTLVLLLPLDLLFLGAVGKKLFAENVGDMILATPRMAPAILFYIIYLAGIVIFVNGASPSDWIHNLQYGALFGVFCYSTFELTNMALLKHWGMGRGCSRHRLGRCPHGDLRIRRRCRLRLDNGQALVQ